MFGKLKKDELPVLFEITNLSKKSYEYFKFNSDEYSLFSYEQEVLLITGYHVNEILEQYDKDSRTFFLVQLKHFINTKIQSIERKKIKRLCYRNQKKSKFKMKEK